MSEHGTPQQGSLEIINGDFRVPEAPQPDERSHPQQVMDQARAGREHAEAAAAGGRQSDPNARREEQLANSGAGGGLAEAVSGDLPTQNQPVAPSRPAPLRQVSRRAQPSTGSEAAHQLEAETQALLKMRREGGDPEGVSHAKELRNVLTQHKPPVEVRDRSYVINEGDETPAVVQQVGSEELHPATNQDLVVEQQRISRQAILRRGEQFNQPPPPEPFKGESGKGNRSREYLDKGYMTEDF